MKHAAAVFFALLVAVSALGQDDPVARARTLAMSGDRAAAIALLEQRLAAKPDDEEARTLLGTVLAWDRQFDRARNELQAVLARDPNNADARAALANVEKWSRRQPADAANEVQLGVRVDGYEGASDWREATLALRHRFAFGPTIARVARGERFGLHDTQLELEAYPRVAAKTYLYVAAGAANEHVLYPRTRLGAELFHGFGKGFEVSVGDRWLDFAESVNVATASLSKYAGNWLFTARGFHADRGDDAAFVSARRYFGDGTEYAGLRIGRGSAREELRSANDLELLRSREIAVETRINLSTRLSAEVRGALGRESGRRRVSLSALGGWRF